jgi:DNA-directed RNA polymerase specialized sigma24 family protein
MTDQAKVIRGARVKLKTNSQELAELLGVSLPTLRSWIAPATSKMHRSMPKTAQLLLERILAEDRSGKRRR